VTSPSRLLAAEKHTRHSWRRRTISVSLTRARRRRSAIARVAASCSKQARAGADFKAIVVFHVTNPNPVVPETPCNIKGRVLALHGSADPVTPKPMMDALEEEMTKAEVDWQVMMFGGAVHSFCDPTASTGPTRYDEKLCRKSYMLMRDFFAETL
jgi:dienelactone hydrolase